MTVNAFPTVVVSYAIRERAEAIVEQLRGHEIPADVIPGRDRSWAVVVPVVQYPEAKKLARELGT